MLSTDSMNIAFLLSTLGRKNEYTFSLRQLMTSSLMCSLLSRALFTSRNSYSAALQGKKSAEFIKESHHMICHLFKILEIFESAHLVLK